jgi:cell division protein FtsL
MTDWADGIEARNYGIQYKIDTGMLLELMRTITALAMVAGALLFYSWVRSEIINMGYESQRLFTIEESLRRTQNTLILEEETLRNPERIDAIARNDLGMTPLRPNQWIPLRSPDPDDGASGTMAMANSETLNLKKPATIRAGEIGPIH